MAGNAGIFNYAAPPGGGGCLSVVLEWLAGMLYTVVVAGAARFVSGAVGGKLGVALAIGIWTALLAIVVFLGLRHRTGYLIGFLTVAGAMGLLIGLCGWGVAVR